MGHDLGGVARGLHGPRPPCFCKQQKAKTLSKFCAKNCLYPCIPLSFADTTQKDMQIALGITQAKCRNMSEHATAGSGGILLRNGGGAKVSDGMYMHTRAIGHPQRTIPQTSHVTS